MDQVFQLTVISILRHFHKGCQIGKGHRKATDFLNSAKKGLAVTFEDNFFITAEKN